jgi:hypothetical protein
VLLAIGLAINLMLSARNIESDSGYSLPVENRDRVFVRLWHFLRSLTGLGLGGFLLCSVALGALAFLNTWDFPIYVGLVALFVGAVMSNRDCL